MSSPLSPARLWSGLTQAFHRGDIRSPRLAVLIDGDGVSPGDATKVLEHVPELGRICILRTYGNFTGRSATAWTKVVRTHGVVARHMPSVAPGKNATDIALTIDAVEMLLTRRIETFVLITSDSDFTPLAHRIREEGKDVIGFGSRSTPASFRSACAAFSEIRSLTLPVDQTETPAALWSRLPGDAEALVVTALTELGWDERPVELQTLGEHLARGHPRFDSRTYRRRTLTDLMRDLPSVELIEHDGRRYARPAVAGN